MMNLRTIILAAGKGVRMNSDTPKVLHKVGGKPIIHYVLEIAKAVGSLKIFVVVGHHNKLVESSLGKGTVAVLQKRLLGTADAIRSAQPYFKGYSGDVLILCGDTPLLTRESIARLIRRHRQTKAACSFLTAVVDDPSGYGRVIRDSSRRVIAIREEKDAADEEKKIREINTGVYCFRSKVLFETIRRVKINKKKKEFYLTDVLTLLKEKEAVIETVMTGNPEEGWGVNSREDLAVAESTLRQRTLKKWMARGVTIVDPATTFIEADVAIGRDTIVRPFTVIENDVRIGRRCIIGPFCHIRPASRIGNKTEVGNFAEISRASLGDDCFMKHFSFIGDAAIGNKVNIGAGVVTANFDGINKNNTKVDDGAFIGSDSILVAPVHVGKNAVTGAGCVVVKGSRVPANTVVAGVPAKILGRRKSS